MGVYGAQSITQILGSGNPPTATLGTVAGTGASVSVSGNNITGRVTITTGGALAVNASGILVTLTLSDGASYPNMAQLIYTPISATMAGVLTSFYATGTTNSVSLLIASLTLSSTSNYSFNYLITGS